LVTEKAESKGVSRILQEEDLTVEFIQAIGSHEIRIQPSGSQGKRGVLQDGDRRSG
jgi:hypothetical protein